MSENMRNPLDEFLEMEDSITDSDLFANMSFPTAAAVQPPPPVQPAPGITQIPQVVNPVPKEPLSSVQQNREQISLFAQALAQTPSVESNILPDKSPTVGDEPATTAQEDPFVAALAKAKAQKDNRLIESLSEKEAVFHYGSVKEPITDKDGTFEDLRIKYEDDFPELSESKKVSWSVTYGKVSKEIQNPGSVKVYDIKTEIEKSKTFLEGIKKAKSDADKSPACIVKPRIKAQNKGDVLKLPSYKEFCFTQAGARKSEKAIVILPSSDGRLYEMRKTPIGTFTAQTGHIPELPVVRSGFQMNLPKIPAHVLMQIINFFGKLSDQYALEALVHILYDTIRGKYVVRVPKQKLTHVSVHSVMEVYPDHLIHVMDIHSHNTMPARFSSTDNEDEKATRLYAVIGRLDKVFPDITVRASCGGKFIPLSPSEVFEADFKAYSYPDGWEDRIHKSPYRGMLMPSTRRTVQEDTE